MQQDNLYHYRPSSALDYGVQRYNSAVIVQPNEALCEKLQCNSSVFTVIKLSLCSQERMIVILTIDE